MESSQVLGSSESESGWTMYIGSQIHYDDTEGDTKLTHQEEEDDNEEESDDSMASDASSGQIVENLPGKVKEGSGIFRGRLCLRKCKKPGKQEKKRDERKSKRDSEETVHKADSAASQV
ncbi:hypothetical protein UlMin_040971 [Ulmus minor]